MRPPRLVFPLSAIVLMAFVPSFAAAQPRQPTLPAIGVSPYTSGQGDSSTSDEEALRAAGLSADDGPKLVEYLKQRTLSDVDQGKIAELIKRFGADDFEERVKATEEVELYGSAAVGPLKTAERDSDPEVAYRARVVLKKMEKVQHTQVAAAAVRAIMKLKPEGATSALIGFLPLADDEANVELIRDALIALALKDGKADPALLVAMSDKNATRRSAAYVALTLGGPPQERIRIKDSYPKLREAVLKEKDPEAKFVGLWTLLMTTRDKDYLPEIIGLIPQIGRGRIWQVEDLLLQLAGSHPKDGRFLKTQEALTKSADAWLKWWKEKGDKVNLEKLEYKARSLGITDVIEMDQRGYGQGRILSLGPDMKEKWRINGVNDPKDVLVISNDRIIIVESNVSQVVERKSNGMIVSRHTVLQQPVNISKSSDGGTLVICRNRVVDFDKDWNQRTEYARAGYDIIAGIRLPKGDVLCFTHAFQGANCFRLDSKLKETDKSYTFGRIQNFQSMDVVDDEKILICEVDRVAEYDLKTGKQTWKYDCVAPSCCQRLWNGNTLITLLNANQAVEVDPSGEAVWEYQAKDGLRVGRAHRR